MGKKFLLAAVSTFLLIALIVALDSEESLASGRLKDFGTVMMEFIFVYPLLIAFVVWEHESSRSLRCFSASVGLVVILAMVWFFKINVFNAAGPVLVLLYIFILVSGVSSVFWRLSTRLWGWLCYLALKLKSLGTAA
ncbi:MAG: hypothetical protein WCG12_20285 [Alcaligenaceae bacterium]